jgi:hypothetical protein
MERGARFEAGRVLGLVLTLAGLLFTLAGILHPQGHGDDFTTAVSSMLNSAQWPIAHWIALTSALLLVWAVWLLHDSGLIGRSGIGNAGARLTILGGVFMAVQFAVELAAHSEATALAAGQPHPMTELTESMQSVGWPAWALGLGLLILGTAGLVPRVVTALGIIGAIAFGFGGLLTMGFEMPQAGILFPFGGFVGLWIVWAGIQLTRGRSATEAASPTSTNLGRAKTGLEATARS